LACLRSHLVALLSAAFAIAIWSSFAALSFSLKDVPALQLTGLALALGGALSIPWWREWKFDWRVITLGCYGLFLYHLLFILALRWAPPVQANLVHYLWPTLIVLLGPVFLGGFRLRVVHYVSAAAGVLGAALAILGGAQGESGWSHGYLLALAAAVVWSTYSLMLRRVHSANAASTGLCCLISGALAITTQQLISGPLVALSHSQWWTLVALGAGPMGGAFYLWNFALKEGDLRVIGVLANATPVLSTIVLSLTTSQSFPPVLALALVLIVGASAVAVRQA
jgi:drug/metabolite transporter (DMT)-like permease